MNKRIRILIVILFVIAVTVAIGLMFMRKSVTNDTRVKQPPHKTISGAVGTVRLDLADKQAGNEVVVDRATVEKSSFIVVRDDLMNKPGVIVGVSTLLAPGAYQKLTLPLSADLNGEATYYVTVYQDNGDGVFSQRDDQQVMTSDGKPFMLIFRVQQKTQQPLDIKM